MSVKKRFFQKAFAVFSLVTILNQVCYPTICWALTSNNSQPEIYGYQPVDATDNVSLTSGKFNYTIPITSVPEFPMAIGYSSGMGMDQEAGVFGFGFNGFSGAIGRNMMGLPDDLKGAVKKFDYDNQKQWDVSGAVTYSMGLGAIGPASLGLNVTLTIGFNNYNGMYGALGFGLGAGGKLAGKSDKLFPAAGLGVGLSDDSRKDGISIGMGAGVGISYNLWAPGFESLANYSIGRQLGGSSSEMASSGSVVGTVIGQSVFPERNSSSVSALAPLAYVLPSNLGWGASLTVPLNTNFSITLGYSQFTFGDGVIDKNGYGFMYLNNYDRSVRENIADVTIEGEDAYNKNSRNNPSYLQRDFFTINTMGLSGSMQLYQKEYGVVSRNYARDQYRDIALLGVKTERKETYPWHNVTQTTTAKDIDIIALLKKKESAESKDFDNVLFTEKERATLNDDRYRIDTEPVFKMRGDMAGEFDLSSTDYKDYEPNKYDLAHVPGTNSDPKFANFGAETGIPLYYPVASKQYGQGQTIKRSTYIHHIKIKDIVNAADASVIGGTPLSAINPNPAGVSGAAALFNASFYSHYKYVNPNPVKTMPFALKDKVEKLNVLNQLKNDGDINGYYGDLIGAIEVQNTSGLHYYFNLPVFNVTTKSMQLSGKGDNAPLAENGNDDYSSFDGVRRNKSTTSDQFKYPYAWLLTAVVGDDYIDFDNIPGPSDGDIGYWVKFRYVKVADSYKWRTPFTGMMHIPGALHIYDDDVYTFTSGEKEIYYLSEIESPNYNCKYDYQKRFDGFDAAYLGNGPAYNSLKQNEPAHGDLTGNNCQFIVSQIDLYKKHQDGDNSAVINLAQRKKIKSTKFLYDYSTSSAVPNNLATYGNIPAPTAYHEPASGNIGSGKITLRRVKHIAYDENEVPTYLPSYAFNYWGDGSAGDNAKYNPAYDRERVDQWGNYMAETKAPGSRTTGTNYYHHYTEISKAAADDNAKAYALKQIALPSGGLMEVDYEAQSYNFVEDKTPYVMRHITAVNKNSDDETILTVDVTDLADYNTGPNPVGLNQVKRVTASGEEVPLMKVGDYLYGEIAFYRRNDPHSPEASELRRAEDCVYMAVDSGQVAGFGGFTFANNRTYQNITLRAETDHNFTNSNDTDAPWIRNVRKHMYTKSEEMRALKELTGTNDYKARHIDALLAQYEEAERDDFLDVLRKMGANIKKAFDFALHFENDFNTIFGKPGDDKLNGGGASIYPHWSFLRTAAYKGKYTGGVVKSLKLRDGFNYATETLANNPGTDRHDNNEYGTRYYYDLKSNGTGASSGVVPIEPGGGKSCVIDVYSMKGAGFAAAPGILYSRTTLENNYKVEDQSTLQAGSKLSRKKGKTVYEFYTAKDAGYQFKQNFRETEVQMAPGSPTGRYALFGMFSFLVLKFKIFGKKVLLKIPMYIPLNVKWDRQDQYYLKSYAFTDYTDIFGRPKNVTQLDASGQEIGKQAFTYYGADEAVNVYKNEATADFVVSEIKKPGKMDQVWSESYYTKETKTNLIPWILTLSASTQRNFSYTNMKYTYAPPLLKEVSSSIDGLKSTTQNTGFDYYTGMPIEVRSSDAYNNTKITRSIPAYWRYGAMGPKDANNENINNLTASAGTLMYLNAVINNNVLGASVTEWKEPATNGSSWTFVPYLHPQWISSDGITAYYDYSIVSSAGLVAAYNAAVKSPSHISHNNKIYKPYNSYTYQVALNANGTFQSFTPFNYGSSNTLPWKNVGASQLYAANGQLMQSKDVLSKYTAQLLGYNSSNTIGSVSNSSWAAAVHEGAENTYYDAINSKTLLENDRVQLRDAVVVKACASELVSKTLQLCNFPAATTPNKIKAHVLTINQSSTVIPNKAFASVTVNYNNATAVTRKLYVYMDENKTFYVLTDKGESYDGFFTYRLTGDVVKLLFNPNDYTLFNINNNDYGTGALNEAIEKCDCSLYQKNYTVPGNNCIQEVHTGVYAFQLNTKRPSDPAKGTEYVLHTGTNVGEVTAAEFNRAYKALVWVHNSSPKQTELVIQRTSDAAGTNVLSEQKMGLTAPYVKAGNWSLLRVDVDLTTASTAEYIHVFVSNPATDGKAIYDDFRFLPANAVMVNHVFEHYFNRVTSGLDVDNFASWSAYDQRGRVIKSAIELQNEGQQTVQKFKYNDQRKQ